MPKMSRTDVVALMEAVGFETASALSTGRLEKKINRLDRAAPRDLDLEDEEMEEKLHFVLDAIEARSKIVVIEDRPNIPKIEEAKQATRSSRPQGGQSNFDKRSSKYDWRKILNGSINQLKQGEDYDCKSEAFAMQARNTASKLNMKVRIRIGTGMVVVQAYK